MTVGLVQNLSSGVVDQNVLSRGWKVGFGLSVLVAAICGGAGWVLGGKVASRVRDIGLAVSKLGRGGSEVRVRVSGDDEVGALGRSVQYLATDLAELLKSQAESGSGPLVSMDPLVKQLRDKTVPQRLPAVPGYEVDAALSAGSRGGLDYFDLVATEGEQVQAVAYMVSAEGHGALAVLACRLARDELQRALQAGATPRKALAHTNKVCKQQLPAGCCAKATLLQIAADGAKLYQAGARSPLLICQRGEVLELNAEGLALGLDDGPVFEKSLRPQDITMSPGTRLVLGNDAMHRAAGLLDLLRQHSPRHTNMFMNVVLGEIEQDAGDDGLREDVVLMTVKRAGQE
ncbi:MAG: SpoIIE family protein phosphatase [Planctomycetota bacterium]